MEGRMSADKSSDPPETSGTGESPASAAAASAPADATTPPENASGNAAAKKSAPDKKRALRPTRGLGLRVFMQVVLMAVIVGAVNYLAYHTYTRWDFSRSNEFRLAVQTQQILRSLRGEVTLILFNSPSQPSVENLLARDLDGFFREILFSGKPKIRLETVDPVRQIQRAQEVATRFGFHPSESVLVVEYDDRFRVVPLADFGDFDFTPTAAGELPRVVAFRGEQVLASTLLGLLDPAERTVYFLQGHGEAPLGEGSPISLLIDYVGRQNAQVAPLNLAVREGVPEDAAALFIVGPQYDLSERERDALLRYWREQEGRLFLLLDPDVETPRLHEVSRAAGIEVQPTRVLRTVTLNFAIGIIRDVAASFVGSSDIVARLQGVNAYFPDPVQSLGVIEPAPERIQVRPLVQADETYWGERDHVTDETRGVSYDDGVDIGYPLFLALSSDRSGLKDDRLEIPAAKMIIVGNDRFIWDSFLAGPGGQGANLDFVMSGLNWLLDRHRLTGVVPKTPREFTLTLAPDQLGTIALYTMVVIPGVVALLGLVVWWRRRV
jgi:hypothetical protein